VRTIVAAIALVFAIGAVMPTEADARASRSVEKWGCTFAAHEPRTQRWAGPWDANEPWEWFGQLNIRCPGERQRYVITLSLFEDMPGRPIRLHSQFKFKSVYGGPSGHSMIATVGGGQCLRDGPPPSNPYFTRASIQREGKPGMVWVASANKANPCADGTKPYPYPD